MEFWLPYGKTEVPIAVPDENLLGVLSPAEGLPNQNLANVIALAVQHHVGGQSLLEAAKQSKKVVIAFNSRSAPCASFSRLLAKEFSGTGATDPLLLEGAPDPTQPPSSRALPEKPVDESTRLASHDRKTSQVAKVGELEGGGEVLISEAFATAEIRCVVTNVAVNAFWGYSGGPSFLIPALASENTIRTCLNPTLRSARLPGVLTGNPCYEALLKASRTIRVDLGIHFVEAPDGTIAGAFVGDFMETFQQACSLAEKMFRPALHRRADIVISSAGGAPWDRTLFEMSTGALTAAMVCKDHGMLVLVAECADGLGEFPSARPGSRDTKGQMTHLRKGFSLERLVEYSFERVSAEHRVYLVSTLPEHHGSLYSLLAARSVGNAFQRATRHAGKDATIALMSHGSLTAPQVG